MTGPRVLVLGASGQVGSRVCRRLLDLDVAGVRALAHSQTGADRLRSIGVEDVVGGDLGEPGSLAAAFTGIDRVFLLTRGTRHETNAIDAARTAGVGRVVKLSSEAVHIAETSPAADGPPDPATARHAAGERRLRESGLEHVVLRPTWFAGIHQLGMVAPGLERGELVWLADDSGQENTLALVHPTDVGDVAASCLLADRVPDAPLHLTGPRALTLDEIAGRLSDALGRRIVHVPLPLAAYVEHLEAVGVGRGMASVVEPFVRRGRAPVSEDVRRVLDRPARSLETYLAEEVTPVRS